MSKHLLQEIKRRYSALKKLHPNKNFLPQYLARKLLIPSGIYKGQDKPSKEEIDLTKFIEDHGKVSEDGKTMRFSKDAFKDKPHYETLIRYHVPALKKYDVAAKISPQVNKTFDNEEHRLIALQALHHIKEYYGKDNRNIKWKDMQKDAIQFAEHPLNRLYDDNLTGRDIINKLITTAPLKEEGKKGKVLRFKNIKRLGLISKLKDFGKSQFKDMQQNWKQDIKSIIPKGKEALKHVGNYLNSDIEDIKFAPLGNLVNKGLEKLDAGTDAVKNVLTKPSASSLLPTNPTYNDPIQRLVDTGLAPTLATKLLHGVDLYVRSKRLKGQKVDPDILNSAIGLLPSKGIKEVLPQHMDILKEYAKNKHGEHFLPESKFDTKFNSIAHHFGDIKPHEYGRKQAIKSKFKAVHDELLEHQKQNNGKISSTNYNAILDKHFKDTPSIRASMDKAIREGFTKK